MAKESKIGAFVSGAGKAAKDFLEKTKDRTVQVIDQNDDGKFDFSDISAIAGSVSDTVKKNRQVRRENAEEKARLTEIKELQPIFPETLEEMDFSMSKLIRIIEKDKRHAESEVCKGSIGYYSEQKEFKVICLFRESLNAFKLNLSPDSGYEFFYVDPTDRDSYIALDDYFTHLKEARINELRRIAQVLGAKYCKVTYKEEQASFSTKAARAGSKVANMGINGEKNTDEKKFSAIEIKAEDHYTGHSPKKPKLRYLQGDPDIQTLVDMRMDKTSRLIKQKYTLKLSNTSGIKENEAIKIDAVLKGMKCSGNTTFAHEARNESRRYLDYEIEFE